MRAVVMPPASDEELVREYGGYVTRLVRTRGKGVPPQDVDDVAGNIMAALLAAGVREQFDPDHVVIYQGKERAPNFRSFLTGHVMLRLLGQRDKLGRRDSREILICDQQADDTGTPWVELHGAVAEDGSRAVEAAETARRARAYVESLPVQEDGFDPLAVFDVVAAASLEGDKDMAKVVAKHFGVTGPVARSWLGQLHQAVAESVDAPAPSTFTVAGMVLSARQVREAVAALRGTRATNVILPLRAAGHPLKDGPKGWYLDFAREEVAVYPELRHPSGTKTGHYSHTKAAVIHRLERMVGDIPEAEQLDAVPESGSQPTLRELIEFEVRHLTCDEGKVEEILTLVDQMAGA